MATANFQECVDIANNDEALVIAPINVYALLRNYYRDEEIKNPSRKLSHLDRMDYIRMREENPCNLIPLNWFRAQQKMQR